MSSGTPQIWSAPPALPGLRAFKRFLLESGGRNVSVCVVGGCTEETQVLAVKKTIRGLHFRDLSEMVVRYGATLSRECDVWFPVLHMGTRRGAGGAKSLLQIAREVHDAGLDVPFIIGGHQNQVFETPFPVPDTDTVVLEAGFKGRYLGDVCTHSVPYHTARTHHTMYHRCDVHHMPRSAQHTATQHAELDSTAHRATRAALDAIAHGTPHNCYTHSRYR